jgi:hypothetical protein
MFGNALFGAKVHIIAKIIKIHVAYSLFSEKAFAKFSKFSKIQIFFATFGVKKKRKEKCDIILHIG